MKEFLVDQLHKCFLCFFGGVETDGGITSKMMVCKRWTPFNYGHFDISMLVCPGGVILSSCSFGLPTAAGMDAVGKWEDFPKKPGKNLRISAR